MSEQTPALAATRTPLLTPLRVLLIVAVVAFIARFWVMASTCLVIENDGIDYFSAARSHYFSTLVISRFRTPGYPLFLYSSFKLFGIGAFGIMLLQHIAGALTAVLVARIGLKLANPAFALVSGLLCALDPTLALFGSVMQTECLSVFLFVLCAALALCSDKRPFLGAAALGCVLAFAILLRPTFQVVVPFFILAAAAGAGLSWFKRFAVVVGAVASLALCVAPWLAFNRDRGIGGFAEGGGSAFWISLVQQDLVDRDYPLPPDVARRYEEVRPFHGASAEMWAFVARPADSPEQQVRVKGITKDWAIHSVRKDPLAYLARMPYSFLWQMNYYPESGFIKESQITWFSYMVSCDTDDFKATIANFHFDGKTPGVEPLAMSGKDGVVREFYRWWGINHPRGFPQIPLMLFALATGVWALMTRRHALAFTLLASAALVGVHVAMLFHQGRYSLPSMALWYAVWPVLPLEAWRRWFGRPVVA
jgi:hypothetical protein